MREINGKTYIEEAPHDMQELLEIIEVLRSPDGCSWDREQTHESLKKCFMDETEEVMQAIDHQDDDLEMFCYRYFCMQRLPRRGEPLLLRMWYRDFLKS